MQAITIIPFTNNNHGCNFPTCKNDRAGITADSKPKEYVIKCITGNYILNLVKIISFWYSGSREKIYVCQIYPIKLL